jgi:hypothetical protein
MLVDIDPTDPIEGQTSLFDPRLYPMYALLGALALSVVVAAFWAVRYTRNKKRRKHRHHHNSHSRTTATVADQRVERAAEKRVRKRWRKPRRPHRPLNPTLAQTGGLPPLRDENTPLPPMP